MEVTFFKVFFSKHREVKWLNMLGQSGHLLKKVNDSKYYFEKSEEKVYYYSIEYLDASPKSEDAILYFKSRKELGITPVFYEKNWVCFVSDSKEILLDDVAYKKNARFHFWKALYPFFFGVCGSVLCGYHAFAITYLERIGQSGDGNISMLSLSRSSGAIDAVLNVAKRCANYLLRALNGYFNVWTSIFGESDAVAVLSIIVPVTIALFVYASFHLDECVNYLQMAKNYVITKEKEQGSNEKQEI